MLSSPKQSAFGTHGRQSAIPSGASIKYNPSAHLMHSPASVKASPGRHSLEYRIKYLASFSKALSFPTAANPLTLN